jgi:hypothetical protein
MADATYVPRTSADEDASHRLDAERTAFESSREHDSGTGSPQAQTGELSSKSRGKSRGRPGSTANANETTDDETTGDK